ncbi:acyl-CoA thioesterase [Corallococcus interemptor]|uniref:Thioesterase Superfamily protein n=1 Tax=Corallococcus coralloides (strain ATCC 25202 / DSM 2259 / NBRC 100086 / M2) TaxID=1144275 RepID=H8MI71_CORCM|nr:MULTISPECIES: thioesterase family protein [Corallococcus]AFE06620.1 thioesterase Superfamily protein [Corallococcus coralloides DSM 2259]MBN9683541.1 acyl-CoA thioesterase [Corallococcus sp. NCSPR001]MBZ4333077.1 acyl-CoA thioesterase [Corallococcus sp. AS-1-12]MBZ4373887.1 acyl-CoA thioesterase [Corallococcus sp. AS-1-6]RKG70265.1 acyl-CoA thioesterase [Corallococcus sp. CA054B]
MKPDLSCELEIDPAFHDLDMMEIVWHGHYVKYLELARAVILRKHDYDWPQMRESGYGWPVVEMKLKYVSPIHYKQRIIVRAEITEWENRLRFDYLLRDADTGRKVNQAHTIQVAVSLKTGEMEYVCPEVLWKKLGVWPG